MNNLNLSTKLKSYGTQLYGLDIFAQPIVPIFKLDKRPHFEILSRFKTYDGSYANPEEVFSKKNSDLQLRGLDLIVFEETFKLLQNNSEILGNNYIAKLNASHSSIHNYADFLKNVGDLVKTYKLNPKNITIEINENSDFHIGKFTRKAFSNGFGVSIDDFGAKNWGFLKVLEKVILNTREDEFNKLSIKIDKNCIQNIDVEKKYHKLFEKMIDMAVVLRDIHPDLTIIAEGVEDLTTSNYLKKFKIDYGQGYYWAKPMLFEQYLQTLK